MIAALKILIVPVTRSMRHEHIEKRPDVPAENVQSQRDQDTNCIVLITLLFDMVHIAASHSRPYFTKIVHETACIFNPKIVRLKPPGTQRNWCQANR